MKKFLKEFKEFAMKGNVLDLAVAVIMGAAFKEVVDAVVAIVLDPIVAAIKDSMASDPSGSAIVVALMTLLFVVIKFICVAFVLFLIVKAFNKAKSLKKKDEAPADPTTKICPFCKSEIDIEATRCPHCTSELK